MLRIREVGEVGEVGLKTCVWSGIDQAATRLPPASGCVWALTPTFFLPGSDVGAMDEEALGEEKCDGNGVNLTLSNDIKDTG